MRGSAVPTASPGPGHPLSSFHYSQARVRLGYKGGCCSRESLFHPLPPCHEGLWDGDAFPTKAQPPPRALGVPGPCFPLSPYRAQIQGTMSRVCSQGGNFYSDHFKLLGFFLILQPFAYHEALMSPWQSSAPGDQDTHILHCRSNPKAPPASVSRQVFPKEKS